MIKKEYYKSLSEARKATEKDIENALYQLSLAGSALLVITGIVIMLFADFARQF